MLALLGLAALFFRVPALAASPLASELFRWLLAGGLLAAYLAGYQALRALPDPAGQCPVIAGFAAGFCGLALLVPPFHDIDLPCYINIGWQQARYGLNPYACTLSETPGWQQDPMFRPYWEYTPSAYGFLFTRLAEVLCRLGGGNWWATAFLFRAINVPAFGLTGWLVWRGCRRLRLPHPERAVYLLLWNPLLLVTGITHAHNDLLMGLLTLAGVYAAVAGGWLAAAVALAAATLVKYAALFLVPPAVLFLGRRRGWARAGAGVAAGLLVGLALALPYVGGVRQFQLARAAANVTEVHNSLTALVNYPCEVGVEPFPPLAPYAPAALGAIKLASWAAFAAFAARLLWRRCRGGRYGQGAFVRDCVLVSFALVCLASSKFYPWYLGMFFPLALWLPEGDRLRRAVLAVAGAQLLSLTFVNQAHGLNVVVMLVLPLALALRRTPPRRPGHAGAEAAGPWTFPRAGSALGREAPGDRATHPAPRLPPGFKAAA
jgi:hypothetical protein